MAQDFANMRAWYVVQTYSGMEYAAKIQFGPSYCFNEYGRLYFPSFNS